MAEPSARDREMAAEIEIDVIVLDDAETTTREQQIRGAIAQALATARAEEREACCRDTCEMCREGRPVELWAALTPPWRHMIDGARWRCVASAIRARGEA